MGVVSEAGDVAVISSFGPDCETSESPDLDDGLDSLADRSLGAVGVASGFSRRSTHVFALRSIDLAKLSLTNIPIRISFYQFCTK